MNCYLSLIFNLVLFFKELHGSVEQAIENVKVEQESLFPNRDLDSENFVEGVSLRLKKLTPVAEERMRQIVHYAISTTGGGFNVRPHIAWAIFREEGYSEYERAQEILKMLSASSEQECALGMHFLKRDLPSEMARGLSDEEMKRVDGDWRDYPKEFIYENSVYAKLLLGESTVNGRLASFWFQLAPSAALRSIKGRDIERLAWFEESESLRSSFAEILPAEPTAAQKEVLFKILSERQDEMDGWDLLYANAVLQRLSLDNLQPIFGRLEESRSFLSLLEIIRQGDSVKGVDVVAADLRIDPRDLLVEVSQKGRKRSRNGSSEGGRGSVHLGGTSKDSESEEKGTSQSHEGSRIPAWLYWLMGGLISGGLLILIVNGRRNSSAHG